MSKLFVLTEIKFIFNVISRFTGQVSSTVCGRPLDIIENTFLYNPAFALMLNDDINYIQNSGQIVFCNLNRQ